MNRDLHEAGWRKSSKSGGEGTECVELHPAGAIRDSKNLAGGVLRLPWTALVAAAKDDRLD